MREVCEDSKLGNGECEIEMKWLIVEDALRDRRGHWSEYVSTFVRGLRALGDEVEVLCDRRAEGFILEKTGALPVLPESIWHRMGDGAGALKRYARVPGHAWATFLAMRRFFRSFSREKTRKDTKSQRVLTTDGTDIRGYSAGLRPGSRAGAVFSNPSTSELARDCENTSLNRSAVGPASESDSLSSKLADSPVSESLTRSASDPVSLPANSLSPLATAPEAQTSSPATRNQLRATSGPPDWIFVPTVLVHHLLGWWMLVKTGSLPKESRVLLFFPNLPIRLEETGRPHWMGGPTTKLMAWLFGQLRGEVESGRVVLGVETHAMRRAVEGLIGMRVVYLPHPVEVPAEARRRGEGIAAKKLTTEDTESTEDQFVQKQGGAWASQAGAAFSNPSTSELARDCANTSLDRSAFGPASLPATSYPHPATSASPIVFGCYGAARWEKGSDIFLRAIKIILKNEVASEKWRVKSGENQFLPDTGYPLPVTAVGRPLRFAIQWVEDFRDQEGNRVSIDPWLREHPQVEVIGRYFQGDEYERRLAETDVMVLPYRSPYRLRVSRVVIEAMIHGMPVIATQGTTLFEQAEEYGVVVGCEEGSAESLARAILGVAEEFGGMREMAERRAGTAAGSFSVGYFRELVRENGQNL